MARTGSSRFKGLRVVARHRSARDSDARLLPSEAGSFADFTVRAVVRQKANETECIDTVYLQKKQSRSGAFSADYSEKHVKRLIPFKRYL
jgi:hypothetical protein